MQRGHRGKGGRGVVAGEQEHNTALLLLPLAVCAAVWLKLLPSARPSGRPQRGTQRLPRKPCPCCPVVTLRGRKGEGPRPPATGSQGTTMLRQSAQA